MSNTNSNNLTIFFVSLGCDKNLVDSEVMLGILRAHGFTLVDDEIEAEKAWMLYSCGASGRINAWGMR